MPSSMNFLSIWEEWPMWILGPLRFLSHGHCHCTSHRHLPNMPMTAGQDGVIICMSKAQVRVLWSFASFLDGMLGGSGRISN